MTNGHFKLQRRFFDHWLWSERRSFSKAEAWLDLLQIAAFKPTKRIVRDKLLPIEEGEIIASLRYLAERWMWNKDKVGQFLALLESDRMIRRSSRQGESVISLTRYKDYARSLDAGPDTETDRGQTEARQRPDKEEEGKEGKPYEREKGAWGRVGRPTLSQARSAAQNLGITQQKADEWWNCREASEWMKGMAGGGIAPVGTNWQADLKTYAARGHNGNAPNPKKTALRGADIEL
jgi:hypothetical protein